MFKMFAQAFSALTVFFAALENFAMAFFHLSTWGKEAAGAFADESKVERDKKMAALQHSMQQQAAALANNSSTNTTVVAGQTTATQAP
jgi:hypothetical protein